MNKKKLIISVSIFIFIITPLILYGLYMSFWRDKTTETPEYIKNAVTFIRDKDTGERVESNPNLTDQTDGNNEVVILGLTQLTDLEILKPQMIFIKESINNYNKNQLDNKYSTITLMPQYFINDNGIITSKLRLGQGEDIVPITITALNTGETRVVITDSSGKYGGNYDSGELFIVGE